MGRCGPAVRGAGHSNATKIISAHLIGIRRPAHHRTPAQSRRCNLLRAAALFSCSKFRETAVRRYAVIAVSLLAATAAAGCAYEGDAYYAGGYAPAYAYGPYYAPYYGPYYGPDEVYYDGFYGPYWGGYWGDGGIFYYSDGDGRFRRAEGHHFDHQSFPRAERFRAGGTQRPMPPAGGMTRAPRSGGSPRPSDSD